MKNCGVDRASVCNYIIPVTGSQIYPFSWKIYRWQHLTRIFYEFIEYHSQEQWQYRNGFSLLSQDLQKEANAFSDHCCTCLIAGANTYEQRLIKFGCAQSQVMQCFKLENRVLKRYDGINATCQLLFSYRTCICIFRCQETFFREFFLVDNNQKYKRRLLCSSWGNGRGDMVKC